MTTAQLILVRFKASQVCDERFTRVIASPSVRSRLVPKDRLTPTGRQALLGQIALILQLSDSFANRIALAPLLRSWAYCLHSRREGVWCAYKNKSRKSQFVFARRSSRTNSAFRHGTRITANYWAKPFDPEGAGGQQSKT